MPNKWTFRMNKLLDFILKYIPPNSKVLLPFAGEFRFDEFDGNGCTFVYNDINKDLDADHHTYAYRLVLLYPEEHFDVIIADPPYSHYQGYKRYGMKERLQKITIWRKTADRLLKPSGIYIELGFNSTGLRKEYAEKIALGVCCMGGSHNDILIIVQKKYEKENQGDNLEL